MKKDFVVNIKKLSYNAKLTVYSSEYSAGADLFACLDKDIKINPGETVMIKTGIAIELPLGYAGLIFSRSGLATKSGLAPANKVGVIDCDYRGEIIVSLYNHSKNEQTVKNGERIAQLLITPYCTAAFNVVESLSETERDAGGFGSTGN